MKRNINKVKSNLNQSVHPMKNANFFHCQVTVNQFNLAAIKVSVLKAVNIRH